jgi:hypothetical protein
MSKTFLIGVFIASASLYAADQILVASSRSNSIEQFDTSGNWVGTFATTGPYGPIALAQSPKTGLVFATTLWGLGPLAGQLSNRILRYGPNGRFDANPSWDAFTVTAPEGCPTSQTQSLVFDPLGNLWVATAYGTDLSGPICILEYPAANLILPNPPAGPMLIKTTLYRGNQMAFDQTGNLCIASFIDGDVRCFSTSTGVQTRDYYTEIHTSVVGGIEPGGLAFDPLNRMYLTSIFTGQVVRETSPGGPIVLLATLTASPNLLNGNLVFPGSSCPLPPPFPCFATVPVNLYTTAYNTNLSVSAFSAPDPVYEVSIPGGAVSELIHATAPPAVGNDHLWGADWMIFFTPPSFLFPVFP